MLRNYNLILMAIWLGVAFVILAPEGVFPEKLRQQFGGPLQVPVAVLAGVLAAYNGVRWWSYRSLVKGRPAGAVNPLSVRKLPPNGEPDGPNPAFDFSPAAEERHGPPPGPSRNGDHK